jgi:putative ABC transport system substrate-binding protein
MQMKSFITAMVVWVSFGPLALAATPPRRTIAVIKFVTHPALDEMERAFIETLRPRLREFEGVQIEQYNANKRPERAKELAEGVSRSDVVLIVTIATPAAQAVVRTPSNIPLLYGAVADPLGAGILPSPRATGIRNVSPGIVGQAIDFIQRLMPTARAIGSLYNPAEQNSVYVQSLLVDECQRRGIGVVSRTVRDASQLASVTESVLRESDLLYSANDNTVNAGVDSVVAVCNQMKRAFVIGDLSTLSKGPLAAVGLDYYLMGQELANLAYRILQGVPLSRIPPQDPPQAAIWINSTCAGQLGFVLPENILSDPKIVVRRSS